MMRAGGLILAACAALALGACAKAPLAVAPTPERDLIEANLMRDISLLASDEFGGRRPGTPGEELTVAHIIEQLELAGFQSGTNDPGSAWRAPVDLVSTQALESRIIVRTNRGEVVVPESSGSAFSGSRRALIDGVEVVFVGTEARSVAPESITGKIVVMLGEPGVSPRRRATLFEANPAAIITVVENEESITNVRRAYGREQLLLASEATDRLTAFVTASVMEQAFPDGTWSALVEATRAEEFAPQVLEATIAIDARTAKREFSSSNVIGLLPGAVPDAGAVLLLAHWDHLGECGSEGAEDVICNGAIDNASGIAVMLELSRRLIANGPHDRDIYVIATSAEESGLLGARAFAEAPPMPLESIVAAFNFDTVAVAPMGGPVGFVGEGRTPLDPVILQVMEESGRTLGNREFAESFVRRQDGWALLEKGVPAVFLSTAFGSEITLGPYLSSHYHRPSDEISRIELGGAIDDLLLHEELVRRVASTTLYPLSAQ
ncbi:M20/M25/M40 family metallo-hydrolase [uncultured Erythrobacter sp.]|uniref:M20/M25/M40 family metallo-hydrolase n=1 Tax=uncultured Erythrobacter sp. TaxID=263913 RepID=UPI00262D42EE|nr:M20/M25/M40 family metallo-hydrolase [uncultured Erythrobacter sp.]